VVSFYLPLSLWQVLCGCVISNQCKSLAGVLVVIAGSKGKERFRRPLRKGSNTPRLCRLPLLGICRSSFGAGVPVEAEWSWIRHVFDGGVTSSSCCRSLRFFLWLRQWTLLLRTRYDPPGSASPSLSIFLSPT
jgi:hypothetical protein